VRSPRLSPPILFGIAVLVALALPRADAIRERAEQGLGRGMPAREAELARGFVLGEDEGIDPRTEEDFRRSGLAHLLAVSGQNVMLLALLAMPVLAAFGIPLRERLVWVLALIALYVPLAGAGPSIQRAGVMGAAGLLATLAGRRASRLYALLLALGVTVAIDPTVAADVGWQLSFAAVAGIFALAAPLRAAIAARIGAGALRRGLADGAAVTIAATLATAPLVAFHFGTLSTTTLVANLLAMPAVAPAMWLGMVSAAAAQVPGLPLEVPNGLNALLLGYIAQVAAWCGRPSWAEIEVQLGGAGLACSYLMLAAVVALVLRWRRHRRLAALKQPADGPISHPGGGFSAQRRLAWVAAAVLVGVLGWGAVGGESPATPISGLRVEILDIGQGDAILLRPAGAPAVLVDGGPPGEDLARRLEEAGVERLGAAVVTHDQSDHTGGIEELWGRLPVARLIYARLGRQTLAAARAAGAVPIETAAGTGLRSGRLRLQVLWPPPGLVGGSMAGIDPNQQALVLLVRWRGFSMLLSADAEAEAVPLDPGPVDVLKVAHHGSDDAGLAALLERTGARLAVISVGSGNPYGHPTAATLATLGRHGVETLRTDRDGTVRIDVDRDSVAVVTDG